ncbi:peptide/nickel transport system ATP-binding protein [Devosia enhydra]|uniref:Peptide/nickel transport system ATP-binding protein n=1 Tax=Devosia enhydra TaxID=665118 RepID=A0A1K2HXW3_9HYPH|nr:ABC transporter ATP-binding protein [Devosia enhydra]SFZ84559.1 peptide/nickel transport system ATP-binding protein [Devosia enhydra]
MTIPVDLHEALTIEDLRVGIGRGRDRVELLDGISLSLRRGEILALVGESGSGKSMTALAAARLLPPGAELGARRLVVGGADVASAGGAALDRIRGKSFGFVFQEPMTSLNPLLTIGEQIAEPIRLHLHLDRAATRSRVIDLLGAVGFPAASTRLDDYPHQLSGGQRQRAMIAMAIACNPPFLFADEPTTALDVTTQAQVLTLLRSLCRERGMGMLLITHDLGVVSAVADRVAVMYAGRIVETGPAAAVLAAPHHPYADALRRALPRVSAKVARLEALEGQPPSPRAFPTGCRFHPRCARATARCRTSVPALVPSGLRTVACFNPIAETKETAP